MPNIKWGKLVCSLVFAPLLFYSTRQCFPVELRTGNFGLEIVYYLNFILQVKIKTLCEFPNDQGVYVLGYYKFRAADWSPNDDLFFFILNEQNAFDELFWNEHLIQTKWQKYAGPPPSWKAVAFFLIIAVWTARRQILMLVPDFCTEPSEGLGGIADLIMILNNQLSSRMICFTLKLWVLFFCSWESMIAQTAAV